MHTDHLGSTSTLSYLNPTDGSAGRVLDSRAFYTPFGGYRLEPTGDYTDQGYTGHLGNNSGSNDIGLIYMNARFYVSGITRFASADTIVPSPERPQSYNRYSYVRNSPLNRSDPTGHRDVECSFIGECGAKGDSWMEQIPGIHEPKTLITRVHEPKPDFPIAVPWSKEFGDEVSTFTDVVGTIVSGGKAVLSGVAVSGYSLGPLGGIVTSTVGDQVEDYGDWVTLGLDIVGEVFNGDTRTAFEYNDLSFNHRGTLILGQDVTLDLLTMGLDRIIPGSEFDLASNIFDTGYGVAKLTDNIPNVLEIQISTYESPFFEVLFYDPSVDE